MSHIKSIGTALPENVVSQEEVLNVLAEARGSALPPRLKQILGNSGIESRYLARPAEYYLRPRSWKERADIYAQVGMELAQEAAHKALESASLTPADIDAIVFISTTGTVTPSIPSALIAKMGFRQNVQTMPVFGYGCAGGLLGLRLADQIADAKRSGAKAADNSGQNVLLISLELCSLSYDYSQFDKKNMIATALFADGCAAAVLSGKGADAGLPTFRAFDQKTWPDTRDMMGWDIGETGFDLVLARDIPAFVAKDFAPFCDVFLSEQGLSRADMGQPACHPGGGRVVDALDNYFGAEVGGIDATREVLKHHGNMSSPTILFVLKHILDGNPPKKPIVMTALGPGFTAAVGILNIGTSYHA